MYSPRWISHAQRKAYQPLSGFCLSLALSLVLSPWLLQASAPVSLSYAKNLHIQSQGDGWIVSIASPYRGAKDSPEYLLLPEQAQVPKEWKDKQLIRTPLRRVISMSTVNLPYLLALHELESIVGMDDFDYVNTPEALALIAQKKIKRIGSHQDMDKEKIIELQPDAILTYAVGDGQYDTHQRLQQMGIPAIIMAGYMENHPLGRVEWLQLYGLLFDKQELANQVIGNRIASYQALCTKTKDILEKPSVFCSTPFKGIWYIPGGDSYVATLLHDAGANYLWQDRRETGSIPLDMEIVFEKAARTRFWLAGGHPQWQEPADMLASDPRFANFLAYQEGNIYCNDKRTNANGGNDIFESGTLSPELVLADLIRIFHPALMQDTELTYHRQLKSKISPLKGP